ncbi:MAG: GDSL-type esterase/lipase family protein [Gammaproteobacteria bacterium]|jgi:acetyl esterase/lipase/lysophospholipase L1-like esterase
MFLHHVLSASAVAVATISLTSVALAQDEPERLAPPPLPATVPAAWLDAQVIPLWPDSPPGADGFAVQPLPADWPSVFVRNVDRPALHVFVPESPDGRAVLAIPGGAYQFVSVSNEGVDLAARLTPLGITVFVLTYRLPGEGWDARSVVPLQDAQRAMRVIRAQAGSFSIDPDTVAVLGFSAGGHLAASLATRFDERAYATIDATDRLSARPAAAGLVYPVVTMFEQWTHALSRELLLGPSPSLSDISRASAELNVDAATPPVFIVHAIDDRAVPVENSIRLMEALREAGRPVEAHLLQEGGHAFGVGFPATPSAQWPDLFDAWWNRLAPETGAAAYSTPVGVVAAPCAPQAEPSPALAALLAELFFEPRTLTSADLERLETHPDLIALNRARRQYSAQDWAGLCRYSAANDQLLASGQRTRVVFIGDSITENWTAADPAFFSSGVVGRGIGGQTTPQILLRLRADVVSLQPDVVHILAGTNDVAGNTGPVGPQDVRNNIISMVEIARANGIDVILGSIPPAAAFSWRPDVDPVPVIAALNDWLRDYAAQAGIGYVDYFTALAGPNGELRADLGNDGVHPNRDGYAVMRELVEVELRRRVPSR